MTIETKLDEAATMGAIVAYDEHSSHACNPTALRAAMTAYLNARPSPVAEPTHWHNGMGQVLTAQQKAEEREQVASRFDQPLYAVPHKTSTGEMVPAVRAVIEAARQLLKASSRTRAVSDERAALDEALYNLELCEDPAVTPFLPAASPKQALDPNRERGSDWNGDRDPRGEGELE